MELLPPIAAGDLGRYSVAELVAAAFRANATGTLALEQGSGESRLFMRYGMPCGALLYVNFRSFGYFLLERDVLDPETLDRTLAMATAQGRRHGDLLVEQGLLTREKLNALLFLQHEQNLETLCKLREGRYELRGWERPPEWTEPITLCPLRALVSALKTDEMFDRRASILKALGHEKLRKAADFDDLVGRLRLDPVERRALGVLEVSRPASAIGAGLLDRSDAEAFACAVALLGVVEVDDGTPRWTPAAMDSSPPEQLPIGAEQSDGDDMLRPLPEASLEAEAGGEEEPAPYYAPPQPAYVAPAYPGSSYVGSAFEAPQPPAMNNYAQAYAATAYGTAPRGIPAPVPPRERTPPPPPPPLQASADAAGEFDFQETGDADEPLELDLDRAPKQLARAQREERLREQSRRAPPRPPPKKAEPPPPRRSDPPPARPPAPEKAKKGDYNPFGPKNLPARPPAPAAPFVPPVAPARPVVAAPPTTSVDIGAELLAGLDQLDVKLEEALRGPAGDGDPYADEALGEDEIEGEEIEGETIDPEPLDEPEEPVRAVTPRPGEASAAILEGIEDLVGELPAPEVSQPLTLDDAGPAADHDDGDELALAAAQEAAHDDVGDADQVSEEVVDDDELALSHAEADGDSDGDVEAEPAAQPVVSSGGAVFLEEARDVSPAPAESDGAEAVVDESQGETAIEFDLESRPVATAPESPAPAPVAAPPEPAPRPRDDARRRLLHRAFANVGGSAFSRDEQQQPKAQAHSPGTAAVEEPAARPLLADAELEKDIATRLARVTSDDHFARLDLPRTAQTDQVKEAFLTLAKRYHPDRLSASGQFHLLPQVRELFARIKESYDALVDPVARTRYASSLETKDTKKATRNVDEGNVAFQKATVYLRRKDLKNAEAELFRSVDADPTAEHLAELAFTMFSNPSRRDEARDEIRELVARSLKATPDHERAYLVAAIIARADGELDKSEKWFRKALEKNPKSVEASREVRLIDMRRAGDKKPGLFDRLRKR